MLQIHTSKQCLKEYGALFPLNQGCGSSYFSTASASIASTSTNKKQENER